MVVGRSGDHPRVVSVLTGAAVGDAARRDACLARRLGAVVAGEQNRATRCSARAVDADAVRLGTAFSSFLAAHGAERVAVLRDETSRSLAMSSGVAHASTDATRVAVYAADAHGALGSHPDAVVVTTSLDAAPRAIDVALRFAPLRGIYLAPWLLDRELLASTASQHGSQIMLGAPVNALSGSAQAYLAASRRVLPLAKPSFDSFEGYLVAASHPHLAPRDPVRFYVATKVGFLPPMFHSHPGSHLWLGDYGLVPIGTAPL